MPNYDESVRDFLRLVMVAPTRPTIEFLGRVMRAFQRLPFENITKILRYNNFGVKKLEDAMRTPDIVLSDHIDFGTGGTCFSLTFFFQQVLEFLGYKVYPVMCDRSYGPNTHCALIGEVDGKKHLIDPGYLMQEPLLLPDIGSSSQRTPFNNVVLRRLGDTTQYTLVTEQAGSSKLRYRLRGVPLTEEEFKKFWLDSFSWPMMHHICVTKIEENGQLFVRDNNLRYNTIEKKGGEKIKRGYDEIISKTFRIDKKLIEEAKSLIAKK